LGLGVSVRLAPVKFKGMVNERRARSSNRSTEGTIFCRDLRASLPGELTRAGETRFRHGDVLSKDKVRPSVGGPQKGNGCFLRALRPPEVGRLRVGRTATDSVGRGSSRPRDEAERDEHFLNRIADSCRVSRTARIGEECDDKSGFRSIVRILVVMPSSASSSTCDTSILGCGIEA
jgi:hypothetical protein